MVVRSPNIPDRLSPAPPDVLGVGAPMLKFTRSDLAVLGRLGLVPEDASTELLDGIIVHTDRAATGEDIFRVGRQHRVCVEQFSDLRTRINNDHRHVQSQQPLACGEEREPQPDFMVIRGRIEDLTEDGPAAADAFCVVEVADSSYERDTGPKLKAYAASAIRQYIIINLRNRTAEVYADPDPAAGTYPLPSIVPADRMLDLRVGDDETFRVPLVDLLP